MLTGLPPFQCQTEYLIFQKIQKLEYCFHEGFDEHAKDLIGRLLVIEPSERLGANDGTYYTSIRAHPYFAGIDFDRLHESSPPVPAEYLPPALSQPDPCWARNPLLKPGADNLHKFAK